MNERSVSTLHRSPTGASPVAGFRLALVGTYPPTRCGIATFTASLRRGLLEAGAAGVDVFRVLQDGDPRCAGSEVVAELDPGDADQVRRAGAALSAYDAVVVQHEFGIYGPGSGRAVAELVGACSAPLVVTMHTVADDFDSDQRRIVEYLADRAATTVVLSDTAARILVSCHGVDPVRVEVIPHGSERGDGVVGDQPAVPAGDPLFLTWGLIGPGKGLDWAVSAVPLVRERLPRVHWVIAGQTHPKVAVEQGERYRRAVEAAIDSLGAASHITLVDDYLSRGGIERLVDRATAVLLPYDSTQQTSSGVLMEAVAAGVPVVATAFPQAVEIATRGGALVVPHRDVEALAAAMVRVALDRDAARRMVEAQRSIATGVDWRQVGAAYLGLIDDLVAAAAS